MFKSTTFPITLLCCIAAVIFSTSCGPIQETAKSEAETSAQGPTLEELQSMSELQLLQWALDWAEGKSPEETLDQFLEEYEYNDDHDDRQRFLYSWKYKVTLSKLVDAYGSDDAKVRWDNAADTVRERKREKRQVASVREYNGDLTEYPEILSRAGREPEKALQDVDALLLEPGDTHALKIEVLKVLARERPEDALKLLETRNDIKRRYATSMIMEEWVVRDEAEALAYLEQMPASSFRDDVFNSLLWEINRESPERALEMALNAPISRESESTVERMVENYLGRDPENAMAWLSSQELNSSALIDAVVDRFHYRDPEKAADFLHTVDPKYWKSEYFYNIGRSLAKKDMNAALQWAESSVDSRFQGRAFTAIFREMANRDADTFKAYLSDLGSLGMGRSGIRTVLDSFARYHPESAMEWALGQPDSPMAAQAFTSAAVRLISSDPAAIEGILQDYDGGDYRAAQLDRIVSAWANHDFSAALEWATGPGLAINAEGAMRAVGETWMKNDASAALAFTKTLPKDKSQYVMLDHYADIYGTSDPEGLVAFFNEIDLYRNSQNRLTRLVRDWGKTDPERAMNMVDLIEDTRTRDSAIQRLSLELNKHDLQASGEWLASVDMSGVESLTDYTVKRYVRELDNAGAQQWLHTIADPEVKNAAFGEIAWKIAPNELSNAALLMNQVKPGEARATKVQSTLGRLKDPHLQNTFLSSLSLNPEEKAQVDEWLTGE